MQKLSLTTLLIIAISSFLNSCASDQETNDWVKVIREYERLKITITNIPEPDAKKINDIYRVTRSGHITLPHLGSMYVKGRDQLQLSRQIASAYQMSGRYPNPQVTVQVMKNRRLY